MTRASRTRSSSALRRAALILGAAVPALLLALAGCKRAEQSPEEARVQKGRTLYTLHCASCHHPSNPTLDGALGPAVAGSSFELLEARLQRGEYPPGYTPKRETRVMRKMPMTPEDLEALHAYLSGL